MGKRSFKEYDLSVVNLSNKDKRKKQKNQLAILRNNANSEGRCSTLNKTKNYAIMIFDETKNQVEMVKVPYWFIMKNTKGSFCLLYTSPSPRD